MHDFNYHRAADVKDAATKLSGSEDGKLLAGGMTLLPTLKNRLAAPSDLIDLAKIDSLKGISVEGREVVIRAMTTHAAVAASADVQKAIAALAALAGGIGDPAVRHRGTIGGSIANADPAADYPAGVVGLDAIIETTERKIAGDDFFIGLFETALNPGEIVTAARFKIPDRAHYLKFRHPASGYAVVGVMIAQFGPKVRVAVTGAGPSVFRVAPMEAALEKSFTPGSLAGIEVSPATLMGDIHCSAEYRAHLIKVYARRAVEALTA
jgi:aerobic carbon-monoxide dehydrogenase medium subunit